MQNGPAYSHFGYTQDGNLTDPKPNAKLDLPEKVHHITSIFINYSKVRIKIKKNTFISFSS